MYIMTLIHTIQLYLLLFFSEKDNFKYLYYKLFVGYLIMSIIQRSHILQHYIQQ